MEKDKLLEEVLHSCAKLKKTTSKLYEKTRYTFFTDDELTVRECDTARKNFKLSLTLEYLMWAYENTKSDLGDEVQAAVENAIIVTCKEVEKLIKN